MYSACYKPFVQILNSELLLFINERLADVSNFKQCYITAKN